MPESVTPTATPGEVISDPMNNPPGDVPNLDGVSQGDISSMLDKLNSGGTAAPAPPAAPPVAAPGEPGEPEKPEIPAKFQNEDGTLNAEKVLQSYQASEKQLSQHFQMKSEFDKLGQQNQKLGTQLQSMNQWREQMEADKAATLKAPGRKYSEEEIKEINDDPGGFVKKEVTSQLAAHRKEVESEAKTDREINETINNARSSVDGFKELEPEIAELIASPGFTRSKEGVENAYYSALGRKSEAMMNQAKNMGYTEGYNKHKEEMTKHVESGDKSSIPADLGGLSKDQIDNSTPDELRKLLTTHNM